MRAVGLVLIEIAGFVMTDALQPTHLTTVCLKCMITVLLSDMVMEELRAAIQSRQEIGPSSFTITTFFRSKTVKPLHVLVEAKENNVKWVLDFERHCSGLAGREIVVDLHS